MYIDIFFGIVLIIGFFYGYSKGLIKTVFSILSILLGIVAAMKLSPLTINVIEKFITDSPRLSYILGFLMTFILVIIVIRFLGNKLEGLLKLARVNFFNKLLGGGITAIFFGLLFSTVVWFLNEAKLITESQKDTSYTYYHLEPVPGYAREQFEAIKPVFREFWDKTVDTFDKVKEKGIEIQEENEPDPAG